MSCKPTTVFDKINHTCSESKITTIVCTDYLETLIRFKDYLKIELKLNSEIISMYNLARGQIFLIAVKERQLAPEKILKSPKSQYTYSGRGKYMPLSPKSKVLESNISWVTEYFQRLSR